MQEAAQRLNHLGGIGVGLVQNLLVLVLGLIAPVPRILKGRNLRLAGVALRRLEQQVVIALAVVRRIEIDQIDALFGMCWRRISRLSPKYKVLVLGLGVGIDQPRA